MKLGIEYVGRVYQDGMLVATVEGRGREFIKREVAHYMLMYGQDGPVTSEIVRKRAKQKRQGTVK